MNKVARIASVVLIVLLLLHLSGISFFKSNQQKTPSKFRFIREESHFVDYTITGDEIRFRYSIRFENRSDMDRLVTINAEFAASETKGWLEDTAMSGLDEHGEYARFLVKSHQTTDVIFTFKGKYLGGEVNTELSFPNRLVMTTGYPQSE